MITFIRDALPLFEKEVFPVIPGFDPESINVNFISGLMSEFRCHPEFISGSYRKPSITLHW